MAAANMGSIRATIMAAFAICILAAGPAHGQFLLGSQFKSWWGNHSPVRHKHHHRHTTPRSTKKAPAQDAAKGPLQIIVSIADQRISVYDDGALIARSSVSTGVPDHPTPSGVFSIISKNRWHRSNLYSAAPMPYMQRLTWSGIALHAGVLPGYPASHGCIRLKKDFAIRLWHLTKRGTRVIIASDDVRPVEIAHPHFLPLKLKTAPSAPESAAVIAENAMIDTAAVHPRSTSGDDAQQVTDAQVPGSNPATIEARRVVPVSIFVSRKSSRLLVHRGFRRLFEAPITIRDPEEPLGTHVFTVMDSPNEGAALRWTVVSIPEGSPRPPQGSTRRHKSPARQMIETTLPDSSPNKAKAALGRIDMPPDAVERIAELLTPGSSFIVSDYGLSRETGYDTDFIVETH
jgi:L,D-transpeptidase catalytic domain